MHPAPATAAAMLPVVPSGTLPLTLNAGLGLNFAAALNGEAAALGSADMVAG